MPESDEDAYLSDASTTEQPPHTSTSSQDPDDVTGSSVCDSDEKKRIQNALRSAVEDVRCHLQGIPREWLDNPERENPDLLLKNSGSTGLAGLSDEDLLTLAKRRTITDFYADNRSCKLLKEHLKNGDSLSYLNKIPPDPRPDRAEEEASFLKSYRPGAWTEKLLKGVTTETSRILVGLRSFGYGPNDVVNALEVWRFWWHPTDVGIAPWPESGAPNRVDGTQSS